MKTPIHLNIGLTTNDGQHVSANLALRLVTALGSILAARVVKGDAEDCLAVSVLLPDSRAWQSIVHGIACILRQDCIAVLDGGQGLLIGPHADKWGEFSPAAFIHPSTGAPLEVAARVIESDCQRIQREHREKAASVESDTLNNYARFIEGKTPRETYTACVETLGEDAGLQLAVELVYTYGIKTDELSWGAELLHICASNR